MEKSKYIVIDKRQTKLIHQLDSIFSLFNTNCESISSTPKQVAELISIVKSLKDCISILNEDAEKTRLENEKLKEEITSLKSELTEYIKNNLKEIQDNVMRNTQEVKKVSDVANTYLNKGAKIDETY